MVDLIKRRQARQLLKKGWQACDLHVHSGFSYDVRPLPAVHPKMLYLRAKYKRMTYFTLTDHDTIDAYATRMRKDKTLLDLKDVVRGVELTIHDVKRVGHTIHLNVYDFSDEEFSAFTKIAQKGDVYKVISYLERRELPFIYNHPFWCESHEDLNEEAVLGLFERCPVVEHNLGEITALNKKVLELAQQYSTGLVSTTDSHFGALGDAYVITPPAKDFREFFDHIKKGRSYLFAKSMTVQRAAVEAKYILAQIFDRVSEGAGSLGFNPDTGSKFLDALSIRLSRLENKTMRAITRSFLQAFAATRIPALLFMFARHKRAHVLFTRLARRGKHKKQGFWDYLKENVLS